MAGSERGIYPRWGGDCQFLEPVLHHGERQKHHLQVEILPDSPEGNTPFYLMSFIIA